MFNIKFMLYLFVFPIIIYLMESLNINSIFKTNRVIQAKLICLILAMCTTYLTVSFLYDFVNCIQIVK